MAQSAVKTGGTGTTTAVSLKIGVALAVIAAAVTSLYDTGIVPGGLQVVEFLILLIGFFVAGFLAARQTGRLGAASVAGIFSSLLPALIILGANVVMAFVAPVSFAKAFGYHDVGQQALLVAALVQSFVGLILWVVFGAVLGVLGGLIGRRRQGAAR